ncbi:DUF4235 domain-containing protein [Streptomyces sp. NPDC005808]|uniref:DUF4235 domain-containing protein n=1 Tax=Streptomyces sp. NPDC005808 TaxID=3364734 RepID=UPI00369D31ED
MKASKLVYKPVGLVLGAVGSTLAGAAFHQTSKLFGREQKANDTTEADRPWRQVLLAAALQGATFAVVRAVVDRSGAATTRRLTGS